MNTLRNLQSKITGLGQYSLGSYRLPIVLTSVFRYPRARALGGSTIHNALVNVVTGTKDDFDSLAKMFSDDTWSFKNMWNYFKRIEHNLYINPPSPDHGYEGWLKTNLNPSSVLERPEFAGGYRFP